MSLPGTPNDPRRDDQRPDDPRSRHAALFSAHQRQGADPQTTPQHQPGTAAGPSGPGAPAFAAAPAQERRRERSRWVELPAIAALSAVLASGATYGLVAVADAEGPSVTPVASGSTVPASLSGSDAAGWEATAEAVSPSVVAITVSSGGAGSGVVVDIDGHVVTNNHVVAGGGQVRVTLSDGRAYEADIVGTDPSTDLAVLRLRGAPDDLRPITLGADDEVQVGEPVMAIGNPLGLSGTVTTGIVSALDRPVTTQARGEGPGTGQGGIPVVTNAIQTSAAINPGNSGGALVDGQGRLIGINSSIATLGSSPMGGPSGNIGIGFAIPVGKVADIAEQLIENGTAEHAFLGVGIADGTVQDGDAQRAAAGITSVEEGSPAAEAGLHEGDAIIALDGEHVDGAISLVAQVRDRAAGEKVAVTYLRDGERRDVTVTLDVRPDGA